VDVEHAELGVAGDSGNLTMMNPPSDPYVMAVDWSGRAGAGQAESIWVAEVSGGRLVDLRSGRGREDVIAYLIEAAGQHESLVVGLDFAFSLPAWWLREQGFATVRDLWADSERLLRDRPAPFWGAPGSLALPVERRFRRTEAALRPAKSVFQLAGPGAVGVGSLRGMPHLLELSQRFSFWPFDPPSSHQVLEIYPRALTGPVSKGRWRERHAYLERHVAGMPYLERAAGSEDAFDAAVSALVMGANVESLAALRQAADPTELLEGRIWVP
jgi:predicted nuclease with RNAse H fold